MATINASTKISVPSGAAAAAKKKPVAGPTAATKLTGAKTAAPAAGRKAIVPPLKPSATIQSTIEKIKTILVSSSSTSTTGSDNNESKYESSTVLINDEVNTIINDLYHRTIGERTTLQINKPHTASTTRDRGIAAADLATITATFGPSLILIQYNILSEIQRILFPDGIQSLLTRGGDTTAATAALDLDQTQSKGGDSMDDDDNNNTKKQNPTSTVATLKPSISALTLSSLVDNMTINTGGGGGDNNSADGVDGNYKVDITNMTVDSGAARGKLMTPPNAREGCLLLVRALIEIVGPTIEPYIVGAFLAATLDECSSSHANVREAADDASAAIISISNPYSFRPIIAPILLQSFRCPEWRTKSSALDRLAQCANGPAVVVHAATTSTSTRTIQRDVKKINDMYKLQIYRSIPMLIPAIQSQVWDTKAQVSKGAKNALIAICNTNLNADIKPTIPALVNAICKPADTNKAISELMGTTFVVPVDESVLTILCPLLARALKEKLAIHKRAACIVINNMSKLVEKSQAIAPFGNLLVPELHRVVKNVQFEEIRDEALKALASLTKALGDHYKNQQQQAAADNDREQAAGKAAAEGTGAGKESSKPLPVPTTVTTTSSSSTIPSDDNEMLQENTIIKAEQERIRVEREKEEQRIALITQQELEERKRFKEAMDAQIELDKIAATDLQTKKQLDDIAREKQRLSTKTVSGECQACGLKKCKKSCMFYK